MKKKGEFRRGRAVPQLLVAVDERAREIVNEIPTDATVLMWVHKARNPEHHRLAMGVLQEIADAIGSPVEIVLLWLKHETGRFDWLRMPDGRTVENPHSIAFESMDQKEYQAFWEDVKPVIFEKVLPRIDQETYEKILRMIAGAVD